MTNNFIYTGVFFNKEELLKKVEFLGEERLERVIADPHVTFAFRPKTVDTSLFGEKVTVEAVGYGNNGKNEGLVVTLKSNNSKIMEMSKVIPVPHITLSVSADGKPVDTWALAFLEMKEPFIIEGTFGAFTPEGVVTEKEKEN